jgi:glycosyltransferase involved in cell wall biosynthesis
MLLKKRDIKGLGEVSMLGSRNFIFYFTLFSSFISIYPSNNSKKIIVITASYNNEAWIKNYFESLQKQTHKDWLVIYIDDCSTDNTFGLLQDHIKSAHLESKFVLIRNEERMGHLFNQYHAIHACDKDSIIFILDGDDWLAHENAFHVINEIYQDENVWLTYGQFFYLHKNKKGFCKPIPEDILANGSIREISWRTSHPRTFYAGLFQLIQVEDLYYEGAFFPKCADVATMFPMIEMASNHVKFIPEILYIYNDANPISYHHDPTHQRTIEAYLRTLPRYKKLELKPW